MDEQEPVRINLQLPASALDSLSRLAEQLRLLTAAIGGHSGSPPQQAQEYGENIRSRGKNRSIKFTVYVS